MLRILGMHDAIRDETRAAGYGVAIDHRTQLPAVPASAAAARLASRAVLEEWELSDLDDTVSLLVTELVSNGVRHAQTQLELVLTYNGSSCLRISVSDGNSRLPTPKPPTDAAIGGWGLTLIETMSARWGTDVAPNQGKTVWVEIDTRHLAPRD